MEAAKGFGYEHSNLQLASLHRLQHKYDNFGRLNKKSKNKTMRLWMYLNKKLRQ